MKYTLKLFGLLVLSVYSIDVNAKSVHLTSKASVSLLTCSAGNELYSTFGHSALRIKDDSLAIDYVFNYGTFDFNTPNFYAKFLNGELNYMLSVTTFDRFLPSYQRDNRMVTEHKLRLTNEEVQCVFDKLAVTLMPENRFYRYDFFYDNCATRIRDIVFTSKKEVNKADFSKMTSKSLRDYLHEYVPASSWTAQGIDLLLGMRSDAEATEYQRAYLPAYLDSLFFAANLIESSAIVTRPMPQSSVSAVFKPIYVGLIVLVLACIVSFIEVRRRANLILFDYTLFSITTMLSLLLWYMWIFTRHSVMALNLNVLWASILLLPMLVCYSKYGIDSRSVRVLTWTNLVLVAALILLSIFGVQSVPSMAILIALAIGLRCTMLLFKR